jgi:amidophosphoribosyltransferase
MKGKRNRAMSDKFEDECGLFGVCGHADAIPLTMRGLSALQHRGQESAGIAYTDAGSVECTKVMGTVRDLLPRVGSAAATSAIGHVRYGTCGNRSIESAQPFLCTASAGRLALCHNGHIVDIDRLRATLSADNAPAQANDSELLLRRVAMQFTTEIGRAMQEAFRDVTPAYSVMVLTADSLCAVRDPLAMRPLSVGRKDRATVISSESCAFDAIGATYVRDVNPGEIVLAQRDELRSVCSENPAPVAAHCIFELIYFARPDSVVFGRSVAEFRMRLGERLAIEAPAPGDVVVPVPDSAVYGALGYAHISGIRPAFALFRNELVGRSFIAPTPSARTAAVLAKLSPIRSLIKDRRVILVDDSIVRGNTCLHLAGMLRDAGAREVHVRITSPPTIASCHFGVDTPDDGELFAHGRELADMRRTLGVDSLEFLSLEGLFATAAPMKSFCAGCFSGIYPVDVPLTARSQDAVSRLAATAAAERAGANPEVV